MIKVLTKNEEAAAKRIIKADGNTEYLYREENADGSAGRLIIGCGYMLIALGGPEADAEYIQTIRRVKGKPLGGGFKKLFNEAFIAEDAINIIPETAEALKLYRREAVGRKRPRLLYQLPGVTCNLNYLIDIIEVLGGRADIYINGSTKAIGIKSSRGRAILCPVRYAKAELKTGDIIAA